MKFFRQPLALVLSSSAATAFSFSLKSSSFIHSTSRRRFTTVRTTTTRFMSTTSSTRVALCQFPVTADKALNHQTAADYLSRAAKGGAKLVVLPEIWNGPYATAAFGEYAEVLPSLGDTVIDADNSPSAKLLQQHAQQHNIYVVGGSVPEKNNNDNNDTIYNTCLVFDPEGKVVAKHRKVHLFDIDVPGGVTFRESDTLSAGETLSAFDAGEDFGMIGVGICYDIRFPEYALLLGKKHQCNILIYPGAFNLTTGPAHWELLQRARAVDNQCYVLTASPARVEDPKDEKAKYPHYTAWGHSTVVAPWGDIVATTNEQPDLVFADLDMTKVTTMRQAVPTATQKRNDLYNLIEP